MVQWQRDFVGDRKAQTPKFPVRPGVAERTRGLWGKILRTVDDLATQNQHAREEAINLIQRGTHADCTVPEKHKQSTELVRTVGARTTIV